MHDKKFNPQVGAIKLITALVNLNLALDAIYDAYMTCWEMTLYDAACKGDQTAFDLVLRILMWRTQEASVAVGRLMEMRNMMMQEGQDHVEMLVSRGIELDDAIAQATAQYFIPAVMLDPKINGLMYTHGLDLLAMLTMCRHFYGRGHAQYVRDYPWLVCQEFCIAWWYRCHPICHLV